jgi:hypothetical protein
LEPPLLFSSIRFLSSLRAGLRGVANVFAGYPADKLVIRVEPVVLA